MWLELISVILRAIHQPYWCIKVIASYKTIELKIKPVSIIMSSIQLYLIYESGSQIKKINIFAIYYSTKKLFDIQYCGI